MNWKELNQQGFIPGKEETEEEFYKRVNFCRNLNKELVSNVGVELPFNVSDQASQDIKHEAFTCTEHFYGITPDWTPIFFSNYRLSPWHGGCAWIFQLNAQTPTAAFLQLRSAFRHKNWYLGIYKRRELIAHELSHVGRMLYDEPQFEEILAYRTADSKWRRYLGPLVQSSRESIVFTVILGIILIADIALLSVHNPLMHTIALWLPSIAVLLVLFALARLIYRQSIFKKCLKKLRKIFNHKHEADHVIYRLTDREIRLFAKASSEKIKEYILKEKDKSFRWKFLSDNYP